jgi:hypothetical protein
VVVLRIFNVPAGLVTAAVTSLGLLAYDTLIRKKSAKILEIGTLPTKIAIIVTVLAIWGAVRFTSWYPERGQKKLPA